MKRKFLSIILALFLIIPCAVFFSACGGQGDSGSSEEPKILTKSEYSQAFTGVKTAYGAYMSENTQALSNKLLSASFSDEDLITLDRQSQMSRMATACVQFVGFLNNLCNNDTFEIKEDFQEMAIVDTTNDPFVENYKLRIKMGYNADTSIITSEVYCEDGEYITYLIFEILYDFDTSALDYFTITGAMGAQLTASSVNYFKFKDNTLKMLPQDSDAFSVYAQSILTDCNEVSSIEWGVDLPDYSNEYVNAMLGR